MKKRIIVAPYLNDKDISAIFGDELSFWDLFYIAPKVFKEAKNKEVYLHYFTYVDEHLSVEDSESELVDTLEDILGGTLYNNEPIIVVTEMHQLNEVVSFLETSDSLAIMSCEITAIQLPDIKSIAPKNLYYLPEDDFETDQWYTTPLLTFAQVVVNAMCMKFEPIASPHEVEVDLLTISRN